MNKIAETLSAPLNYLYQTTGNFYILIIIISTLLAIFIATHSLLRFKLKYASLDHAVEIARWRRELTKEEADSKISTQFGRTIFMKASAIALSFLRYFVVVAVFSVSLNPSRYIDGITEQSIIPLFFIDNIMVKQVNFILPLSIIAINFINENIGRPKETWILKNLKPQFIQQGISVVLYVVMAFFSAHLYFVIQLGAAIIRIPFNCFLGKWKNKIAAQIEKNNEQIEKEQKEYEEAYPEKFIKIDETAFKEA